MSVEVGHRTGGAILRLLAASGIINAFLYDFLFWNVCCQSALTVLHWLAGWKFRVVLGRVSPLYSLLSLSQRAKMIRVSWARVGLTCCQLRSEPILLSLWSFFTRPRLPHPSIIYHTHFELEKKMHSNPNNTVTLALTNILLEVYDKCVYLRFLFEKNDQNFERF